MVISQPSSAVISDLRRQRAQSLQLWRVGRFHLPHGLHRAADALVVSGAMLRVLIHQADTPLRALIVLSRLSAKARTTRCMFAGEVPDSCRISRIG